MNNLAPMKVVPFIIPRSAEASIRVQVDEAPHLYNHLHQHPEIQLTLICKSSGTLIAGDYLGRFKEGDVFVIGSNQAHVFRNDAVYFRNRLSAKAITVFFDEASLGKAFWQMAELSSFLPFFKNSLVGYRIKGKKQQQISEALQKIALAEGIDKLIIFLELIRLLSSRKDRVPLSQINIQRTIKTYDGNRLNRVIEFTFRENHRVIGLPEAAGLANMTVSAFCKYFKTRTGKTYIHFVNEIRVSNACKLLLAEDWPVSTICYQTGFSNLSNFNRVFKKISGFTPKAYRAIE